jgi:hypothetical protein
MIAVPAGIRFHAPMRTTSHSATSPKPSKKAICRSSLNFAESDSVSPTRRSVLKAWLSSLPKSSHEL